MNLEVYERNEVCIQVRSTTDKDLDCVLFVSQEVKDWALQVLNKACDDFRKQPRELYMDFLMGIMKKAGISCEVYYKESSAQWWIHETVRMSKKEKSQIAVSMVSDRKEPCKSLMKYSMAEIEQMVFTYVQDKIDAMGMSDEVLLHGARVYGSRSREGLYASNSDVDVVVSYIGNISEDTLFNCLNEKKNDDKRHVC